MRKMERTRRVAQCALLISLALALSYMERFLPLQLLIPLPGIKLGLANIVTLVSLYLLGVRDTFAIVVLRCCLGSLFGGSAVSLAFSLTGGLLATGAMALAGRSRYLSVYGVSILGAAIHNIGQICAAMVLMRAVRVGAYLPWLLVASLFTGFATGCVGAGVLRVLMPRKDKEEHP